MVPPKKTVKRKRRTTKNKSLMSKLNLHHSPFWGLMNLIVVCSSITIFSYIHASTFDSTEFKTILGVFLSYLGYEGVKIFRPKNGE